MDEIIQKFYTIFEDDNINDENINDEDSSFSKQISYQNFLYNNNDAFNFILTTFMYFKLFIYSICDCLKSYLSAMNHFLYQFQFTLLICLFLFSFVISFEDNSYISSNLMISAYFRKGNITRITHEMILEKEQKNSNIIQLTNNDNKVINVNINNYKEYNNDRTNNSNLNGIIGDLICNIMNEKNCNYSNYKYNIKYEENDKAKESKEDEEFFEKNIINNRNKKDNNSNKNNEELYLFNIIPITSVFVSIICLLLLIFIIKSTVKSKIRGSLVINLIGFSISYNLIHTLYEKKYYLASNFIFILLMYTNKNVIDSIYLKLKYKRKDFEIFSTNLIAFNSRQFFLKFILLLNATILSAILSILLFKFWLNYLLNYLCLLTLIAFLGNCIEQNAPFYLKPIKNIIMFFIGIFNLVLSKFILKYFLLKEKFNEKYICFINNNKEKNYCQKDINYIKNNFPSDSLYLMNDLFSLYCLDYINGFIDYQIKYYYANINNKSITIDIKNYYIISNNYWWFLFFLIAILIGGLGVYINEFICFFFGLYMTKIFMNNFCKLYNIKICRILNNIIIFRFMLFVPNISKINDIYLINLFLSITNLNEVILLFSFKFIFLLFLLYYIITSNFALYIDYNSIQISKEKDILGNNNISKLDVYNMLYIIVEIILLFLIISLIIIIYNFYENKFIMKVLFLFAVIIFHSLKIKTINEIKEKYEESDYNLYILIWIIISLRLIKLSGSQISLIYLINHLNLILIINYYILNDTKNNNIFKIIIIILLAIGYYCLNSSIFIIDAIAIVISPIIKKYKTNNDNNSKNNNNNINIYKYREQKLKMESLRVYNRLTFLFLLSILLFSLFQIGYVNNYEIFGKYFKELIDNVKLLFKEINERRVFHANETIEFYIISILL